MNSYAMLCYATYVMRPYALMTSVNQSLCYAMLCALMSSINRPLCMLWYASLCYYDKCEPILMLCCVMLCYVMRSLYVKYKPGLRA